MRFCLTKLNILLTITSLFGFNPKYMPSRLEIGLAATLLATPVVADAAKRNSGEISAPHVIADAIDEIDKLLPEGEWKFPQTAGTFPAHVEQLQGEANGVLSDVLEGTGAVGTAAPVNQFLREKGFDMQLDEPTNPSDIVVASAMILDDEWVAKGREVDVQLRGSQRRVPGVLLKEGVYGCDLDGDGDVESDDLVVVQTKGGRYVAMTMQDKPKSEDPLALWSAANDISTRATGTCNQRVNVHFPMVDMKQSRDIEWMLGAQKVNGDEVLGTVTQAKEEALLQMDPSGIKARAAAGMGMTRSIDMTPTVTIDGPFMVMVEIPDEVHPFTAFVGVDDMKDPR